MKNMTISLMRLVQRRDIGKGMVRVEVVSLWLNRFEVVTILGCRK